MNALRFKTHPQAFKERARPRTGVAPRSHLAHMLPLHFSFQRFRISAFTPAIAIDQMQTLLAASIVERLK